MRLQGSTFFAGEQKFASFLLRGYPTHSRGGLLLSLSAPSPESRLGGKELELLSILQGAQSKHLTRKGAISLGRLYATELRGRDRRQLLSLPRRVAPYPILWRDDQSIPCHHGGHPSSCNVLMPTCGKPPSLGGGADGECQDGGNKAPCRVVCPGWVHMGQLP